MEGGYRFRVDDRTYDGQVTRLWHSRVRLLKPGDTCSSVTSWPTHPQPARDINDRLQNEWLSVVWPPSGCR